MGLLFFFEGHSPKRRSRGLDLVLFLLFFLFFFFAALSFTGDNAVTDNNGDEETHKKKKKTRPGTHFWFSPAAPNSPKNKQTNKQTANHTTAEVTEFWNFTLMNSGSVGIELGIERNVTGQQLMASSIDFFFAISNFSSKKKKERRRWPLGVGWGVGGGGGGGGGGYWVFTEFFKRDKEIF